MFLRWIMFRPEKIFEAGWALKAITCWLYVWNSRCSHVLVHSRLTTLSLCGLILAQRNLCARADLHLKKKKRRWMIIYQNLSPPPLSRYGIVGKSAGHVIESLRVQIPAGAAGEFPSPELPLRADSYSVSVPSSCYRSGTEKPLPFCQKVQVAGYTWTRIHPRLNEVGVGWLCRSPVIAVWEPNRKRAHTQLFREHSATVISANRATVDWF